MRKSYLILLVWVAIGIALRFTQLDVKSPWTDEFSTMVFSLGHSFLNVPLNQPIPLDILMQPLVPTNAGMGEVVQHLITESNHPPLYFVLANLWMKLFPQDSFSILWMARSLPAILGAASIPAIYLLGYFAFRSHLVGNLAAAMMAVSPYGIFLAQEARHYTLAILFVIASLGCLLMAVRRLNEGKKLPFGFSIIWILINCFGIASHYFFVFTLLAEAIVLLVFYLIRLNNKSSSITNYQLPITNYQLPITNYQLPITNYLKSFMLVAVGTIAGALVWLPVWQYSYNNQLTEWIKDSDRIGFEWVNPIFQAIAAWITMLSLLPIEVEQIPIVIVSGIGMLIFFIWATPILIRGIKFLIAKPDTKLPVVLFGSFILASLCLFFSITYLFGIDLTRGARYNFVYFPAVILLIGASLAVCCQNENRSKFRKNIFTNYSVFIILLMGFFSSLTVAFNLGYQKYYRPDLLAPMIENISKNPVLIATTHKTHVQTGEMMGLGWEFKRLFGKEISANNNIQFLLAHQDKKDSPLPAQTLQETLAELPRPLDLWLLNFQASPNLKQQNCSEITDKLPSIDGYDYKLYSCQ